MFLLKRTCILLLAIYTHSCIFAQVLEIPEPTNVTVIRQSQLVEISWKMQNPNEVDGYIIKRQIFGQPNVVDGSFNTVGTVNNNNQFNYIDSLGSYGYALPTSRSETYRVVSYKNTPSGKVLYSNMSTRISTIYLYPLKFDLCEKQNKLTWTHYNGFGQKLKEYNIFCSHSLNETPTLIDKVSANDTSYTHYNIDYNKTYYYYIQAISNDQLKSLSNIQKIETSSLSSNPIINADYATVINKNRVEVSFTLSKSTDIKSYILLKSKSINGKYDTIKILPGGIESIRYTDTVKTKKYIRYYKVVAINKCGDKAAESNIANNIVLKAKASKETKFLNQLKWNAYENWNGGISNYYVYRSFDGSKFKKIASLTHDKTNYDDNIKHFIDQNNYGAASQGKFCYYIEAVEGNNNPYGIVGKSKSNVSCTYQEAIVFLPNAINPKSNYIQNRTFKPVVSFVSDYMLIIYDRWGGIVFKSTDPLKAWDGRNNGGDLLMKGTYTFYLQYRSKNKNLIKTSGEINLLY